MLDTSTKAGSTPAKSCSTKKTELELDQEAYEKFWYGKIPWKRILEGKEKIRTLFHHH